MGEFSAKLNRLVEGLPQKTSGNRMSLRDICTDFRNKTGVDLSVNHLSVLLRGQSQEPRFTLVEAFARYFRVPLEYFSTVSNEEEIEFALAEQELIQELNSINAITTGFRSTGLSAESMREIAQAIKRYKGRSDIKQIRPEKIRAEEIQSYESEAG